MVPTRSLHQALQAADPSFLGPITPLRGDASLRHYYRCVFKGRAAIVMDTHREPQTLARFMRWHRYLEAHAIRIPQLFHLNEKADWAVFEDCGDDLLLSRLQESTPYSPWYTQALEIAAKLFYLPCPQWAPHFLEKQFTQEWQGFERWVLQGLLQRVPSTLEQRALVATQQFLHTQLAEAPQGIIHEDFHARNLMVHSDELVLIDFQDAQVGPIFYDAVSLLKDAYRDLSPAMQYHHLRTHYEALKAQGLSLSWLAAQDLYSAISLQRHVRVLFIFARLALYYKKPHYLADMPQVLRGIAQVMEEWPAVTSFKKHLWPCLQDLPAVCEAMLHRSTHNAEENLWVK